MIPGPDNGQAAAPMRPDWAFLFRHPAHWIALGGGSGLSRWAPGTAGTLWGWGVFVLLDQVLNPAVRNLFWPGALVAGLLIGWWACTVTAQATRIADPGFIVWDEVLAIWAVLWLVSPASWGLQLLAFALFRYFDAAKPGPVHWADQVFKGNGWRGGFGILFDDLVAAGCTLLTLAVLVRAAAWFGWGLA